MANNNITNKIEFKCFNDEYVSKNIDKFFTCEQQDIELTSIDIAIEPNKSHYITLLLKVNGSCVTLKKLGFFDIVTKYISSDDKTSDECLLTIIGDLIAFNGYKICKLIMYQED